jgi:hypothetical protein
VSDQEAGSSKPTSKLLLWVVFLALIAVAVLIRYWR